MEVLARPVIYDDLRQMPDVSGNRYEIIGGELFVSPSPTTIHQQTSFRLTRDFDRAIVEPGLGVVFYAPTDVKFSEYDTVVPDILVVSTERQSIIKEDCIEGAPDLIVEIFSPSTKRWDQIRKAALYATHGVREYWQVDTQAKTITILTLKNGAYEVVPQEPGVVRSVLFPDLVVDLAALFAGLD